MLNGASVYASWWFFCVMPDLIVLPDVQHDHELVVVHESHFGGNTLLTYEPMISIPDGEGGLFTSALVSAFGAAGVTTFRYPGGTVTENYVDVAPYGEAVIVEPTEFVTDEGHVIEITNVADFFTAARLHFEETGTERDITFVVPTSGAYAGDPAPVTPDGTIDVGRPVDEEFVRDTVAYVRHAILQAYANDVVIHQFEIGNEFFDGNGANMTAREYGVIAARLMRAINHLFKEPEIAAIMEEWEEDHDFIVQGVHHSAGGNFNSDWANVSIMQGILDVDFDGNVVELIDGFTSHYHFDPTFAEVDESGQRALTILPRFWTNEIDPGRFTAFSGDRNDVTWEITDAQAQAAGDVYIEFFSHVPDPSEFTFSVTEWSVQHSDDPLSPSYYGLQQAAMMVELFAEIVTHGADTAFYWPLATNNPSQIAGSLVDGNDLTNPDDGGLSIHGVIFGWMSETLEGLEFCTEIEHGTNPYYEFEPGDYGEGRVDVHVFSDHHIIGAESDRMVLFVSNRTPETYVDGVIDFSQVHPPESEEDLYFVVNSCLGDGDGDGTQPNADPVVRYHDGYILVHETEVALGEMDGWGLERVEITHINDRANHIFGRDGDDSILGLGGNDTLIGGNGNDRLKGQLGDDSLQGGTGDDYLNGGWGNDALDAGTGDDTIYGGANSDTVWAGDGNDSIHGDDGNDELRGDAGDDFIFGDAGADTLIGADGSDMLSAGALGDLLFGGSGDDFLNGGYGFDRVNGGEGADRFYHSGAQGHGSDWIQDYNAAEMDILLYGALAFEQCFQVNYAETEGAGVAGVEEAFVIHRPTGQILWALVDGAAQDSIFVQINGALYDLMA